MVKIATKYVDREEKRERRVLLMLTEEEKERDKYF